MKLRIALGTIVWLVLISVAHLHLNVGWSRSADWVASFFGKDRSKLQVGFLPVT